MKGLVFRGGYKRDGIEGRICREGCVGEDAKCWRDALPGYTSND